MNSNKKIPQILLVDDDPINNLVTKRLLQKLNPVIIIQDFNKPEEAIEFLKANEVDLIFLDINMPGMNGWDFLTEKENINDKTPVLMLSSSIDPNDHIKSIDFKSVKGFLRKPLLN